MLHYVLLVKIFTGFLEEVVVETVVWIGWDVVLVVEGAGSVALVLLLEIFTALVGEAVVVTMVWIGREVPSIGSRCSSGGRSGSPRKDL